MKTAGTPPPRPASVPCPEFVYGPRRPAGAPAAAGAGADGAGACSEGGAVPAELGVAVGDLALRFFLILGRPVGFLILGRPVGLGGFFEFTDG
jgi:hypothetical protein